MGENNHMSDTYRAMIYVGMGLLHFHRASITPGAEAYAGRHPEAFMERHPALVNHVVAQVMKDFNYELSHLQMCKAIVCYFMLPTRVPS